MMDVNIAELRSWFGLGVAGNFAGHLEQAGEDADFTRVQAAASAPKGIFPWYVPGSAGLLGQFPLAHDRLSWPVASEGPVNLQIEPEVGVACRVRWSGDTVAALEPFALGAFNDCSIRRPGANKISDKKNWGPASKGVARQFFEISDLTPDGPTATLRLQCFLRGVDGVERAYGVDSALRDYSYYGEELLNWIIERLANQKGSADTPLEDVGAQLVAAGRPDKALIGIGATRYTEFGATTYLQPGDEAIVRVYDSASEAVSELRQMVSE